jgi:hypothetical protein
MNELKTQPSQEGKCCPSSVDWSVRHVIGRRKADGTTQYATDLVPAGPAVIEHLRVVADDYSYRFGGVCMQGNCAHWANGCDLGVIVTKVAIEKKLKPRDPCAFKTLCRWFAENGAAACGGCTYVSRGIVSRIDERDPDFKRITDSEDDVQLKLQIRENDFDEDEEEDDKWLM